MTKKLHPRNIHDKGYDFKALTIGHPPLKDFVKENQYGDLSINYSSADAILCLNQALLSLHYQVTNWSLPKGNLCPPIPGRADYIHYLADLINENENTLVGPKVKGLDIGTGASCIYPILGNSIYGWKFVASDINSDSVNHANFILKDNPKLKKNIKVRFQKNSNYIFKDLIKSDEKFTFTMCNPPFYSSQEEANKARSQKLKNLNANKAKKGHKANAKANFGGLQNELWCEGGELIFIKNMIKESVEFKEQCTWFTTLVSNKDNIEILEMELVKAGAAQVEIIEMINGSKIAHILAWKF